MEHYQKLLEAAAFLKPYAAQEPKIGIILGSGLGDFVKEIEVEREIDYTAIPHFPVSTVVGHKGKLVFGRIAGRAVVAMAGRFHLYEGYTSEEVVFPIRIMRLLGVDTLLLSNAAGGVQAGMQVGDLMIITDHISFATKNPLIGPNDDRLGPRFPDMSEPYKKELIQKAKDVAHRHNIPVRQGVYFAVTGPTFETRAEYKLIQLVGGDAVGMSTVPEVIVAVHMGMQCFAMSVITDIGIREEENVITHEEVLAAAKAAEPHFATIFRELIRTI
ncbi:purine-nucleoside phosphorylase [Paraflavisolibacter sp. H34]|uniref:purine-nucleoside phosphorylase n=1 Tax=Huijunlia imazamoxiresistens TaxID=3127457 RepID=UPI00301A3585